MNQDQGQVINEVARDCYNIAASKGWHDNDADKTDLDMVGAFVANCHAEVSELWEAARGGNLHKPCDKWVEMEGLGIARLTCMEEELADIAIRVYDFATAMGINIASAIDRKSSFNATRPHRHGGKLA